MKSTSPVTIPRLARALDSLAIIIDDDPEIADQLLPMFHLLEDELERMRAQVSDLERVRTRARRVRDQRFPSR